MSPWAYGCTKCRHLLSRHLCVPGGSLIEGPYRCISCACDVPQDTPTYTMTRQQYERHMVEFGAMYREDDEERAGRPLGPSVSVVAGMWAS